MSTWYPLPDPTADACDREASWLTTTGDGGPALLKTNGGPWDIVQAYWPGAKLRKEARGVYVTRRSLDDAHPLAQRYRPAYLFALKIVWPVKINAAPLAETEQRNLDLAIGLLLQRIRGPAGDKSHGGRFLSVAEVPLEQPAVVDWEDPETTIPASGTLSALVQYHADDTEFNG